MMRIVCLFGAVLALAASAPALQAQEPPARSEGALRPTNHPLLPADASRLWLAPLPSTSSGRLAARTPVASQFAEAVRLEVDANFVRALPIFSQASLQEGPLGNYAIYYQGLAELRLSRPAEAKRIFQALRSRPPVGYLVEASALREAECDEALGDQSAAAAIYEALSKTKTTSPDDVLMR